MPATGCPPADGRIIVAHGVEVDESSLTVAAEGPTTLQVQLPGLSERLAASVIVIVVLTGKVLRGEPLVMNAIALAGWRPFPKSCRRWSP